MKKLALMSVVATFGLFGLSASAKLPSYCESVIIKGTLLMQNGDKVTTHKMTTDDILSLIDNEYGTSYAKQDGGSGYQLVSYGVGADYDGGDDIFSVADKNGSVVLDNASFNGDDYYLYLYPYEDTWVDTYKGENYNYTIDEVEVYYNSSNDLDSFYFTGLMTDKVNWITYNESYNLKNGQGSLDFADMIIGPISGVISSASVSGSGKDVDYPFDW